jgi:NADH:ubiquinone oxidoreductase subunit K
LILSLASVSFSSLHLETSILIPAIIIITIAINEIIISIKPIISVLRVLHKLNASINRLVSFQGVLNHEEYVVFHTDHPWVSKAW